MKNSQTLKQSGVWLGLSHVVKFPDLCVRITRAIKSEVHRADELARLGPVDGGEDDR